MGDGTTFLIFMLVGAAIGGPVGMLIGGKVAAKYMAMKFVAGAVVGGGFGIAFHLLGSRGGVGPNGPTPRGEGAYFIEVTTQVRGDPLQEVDLKFTAPGTFRAPVRLNPQDDLSAKLQPFSGDVATSADGAVVRLDVEENVPHALRDRIIEELRLGGVRISME